MKLTKKQLTDAIRSYAKRHGYYARTVRAVSCLRYAAIKDFLARV